MVAATLLVERGSIYDQSEDWGSYEFVSLPSPGDRIAAYYNDGMHYLTVICVHHKPVPIAGAGEPERMAMPGASVVAKWTSSD